MAEFYSLQLQSRIDVAHVLAPVLGLVALAAALWWCGKKLGSREVAFVVAWMVLLLLPAFDFSVFPANDLVHDRYFYLPSFGAALLVGLSAGKISAGSAGIQAAPEMGAGHAAFARAARLRYGQRVQLLD